MTHETDVDAEAEGGPEHDHRLPDATEVPVRDVPWHWDDGDEGRY